MPRTGSTNSHASVLAGINQLYVGVHSLIYLIVLLGFDLYSDLKDINLSIYKMLNYKLHSLFKKLKFEILHKQNNSGIFSPFFFPMNDRFH